jgi:hypothetical protein
MNNKLLITLSSTIGAFALFSFTTITPVKALLTAPTDYDFRYSRMTTPAGNLWAVADFNGNNPTNFYPTYQYVSTNLIYTTDLRFETNNASSIGTTGWPVDTLIQFGHTNTGSFSNWSGNGDYIPTNTIIGSSLSSTILSKFTILITNSSPNAYKLTLDTDATSSTRNGFISYNGVAFGINGSTNINGTSLSNYYIPAQTTFRYEIGLTSSNFYLDAIYIKDLGITNEDLLDNATNEGYTDGYTDGTSIGYDTGYGDGYNDGFNDGELQGSNGGSAPAYAITIFTRAFNTINAIMSIQILPPFTIGTLALFPLLGGILFFFKKVIQ